MSAAATHPDAPQVRRAQRQPDAPSVGVVETQFHTFARGPEAPLDLESGATLGPVTVAYETYGRLDEEGSNAILICHALSGSAHAAGYHNAPGQNPGWWEDAIGPGKAFDTDRYFVICSNVLGGCVGTTGPSSLNPRTERPFGLSFPVVTVGDMVKVQKTLLDRLGIERLLCVAGGSMGGMQALEWALRFPAVPRSVAVIAATSRLSPQAIGFNAIGRNSITSDANWRGGDYYSSGVPAEGLAVARMIGHITYLSEEAMHAKFGRRLRGDGLSFDFSHEFQVESYLDHQGSKFVDRFDANSYLYMTKAMDYFDVAASYGEGELSRALAAIRARVLVLSFSSDWLFPPYQSRELVEGLLRRRKDVSYINIETPCGHDAFLLEIETEARIIGAFLSATHRLSGPESGEPRA
jgi:homoserine O-acetyltransferase/O-succinyltransferase